MATLPVTKYTTKATTVLCVHSKKGLDFYKTNIDKTFVKKVTTKFIESTKWI